MRTRTLLTILSTLLLVALALPASAQQPERYRAVAEAAGVELEVLDTDAIRVADAGATIDTAPLASGRGLGVSLSDASRSEAEVSTRGEQDRAGQNCLVPELPEPLRGVVDLDEVCSLATAELVDLPSALGRAELAAVAVDGEALASLLAEVALTPIEGEASAAFDAVEDAVAGPVYDALIEACAAAAPVSDAFTELPLDQIPDELDPIADQLAQDDPCSILLSLIADPPVIDDSTYLTDLTAALEAALADVDGLAIAIASEATGEATDADAGAESSYTTVSVELPSLAFLGTVLDAVTQDVLGTFLTDLGERLAPVTDVVGELPDVGTLLAQFRDLLDLGILTDTDPLARLDVLGSRASAAYDRSSGQITTEGSSGVVEIVLSQTLADLFGVERTQTVAAGESITLLEGTPLASTVAVGTTETSEVTSDGLSGERVEAQAAELQLLTGAPGGGVRLALGSVSAAAFGQPGEDAAAGPLPATGAGAPLAALAVLGAAVLSRRRG